MKRKEEIYRRRKKNMENEIWKKQSKKFRVCLNISTCA